MYFFVDTRNCIKSNIKFPFAKLHIHTHKAVSLRIDCFFRTQKGVIDLCVRFGIKDTVSEPATSTLSTTFPCGNDIRVYDDELAEALKQLSERNRETLLMYYFLEMNNEEIAKKQNISRSGVFQNRHNSLALMKKLLKEKQ